MSLPKLSDEDLIKYITTIVIPKKIPMGSMLLLIRPITEKSDEELIAIIESIKENQVITAPKSPSPFGQKS